MGQYWEIVCLKAMETLRMDGGIKLGEILCSRTPQHLVPLLAVPYPPSGPEYVTRSAPQMIYLY